MNRKWKMPVLVVAGLVLVGATFLVYGYNLGLRHSHEHHAHHEEEQTGEEQGAKADKKVSAYKHHGHDAKDRGAQAARSHDMHHMKKDDGYQMQTGRADETQKSRGYDTKSGYAGMKHGHGMAAKVIPADYEKVPGVEVRVARDTHGTGALNLYLDLTHFRFTPENVNADSKINEGHAHLYVNGKKVARLYGAAYHLDKLPKAEKLKIRVTLNTNMHEDLVHDGKMIEDVVEFAFDPNRT